MNREFYIKRKASLIALIRHYEANCLKYLDYDAVCHMKLDDLQILYDYDQGKVDFYEGELMLLEAEMSLNLNWEKYLEHCIKLN